METITPLRRRRRMAPPGNGAPQAAGNGSSARPAASSTPRCPRRLVLLASGEDSAIAEVLAEYKGADVSGKRLHADLQRLATQHAGRCIAAEWLGSLGWTRFLWCKKDN
jgi:hypothetical protein